MKNKALSLIILLILNLCPFVQVQASAFSDVQAGDPYFEALEYLQDQDILAVSLGWKRPKR
ncbi:MAG: hypothetical protein WC924_05780 [Candidatus Gracilibacteria bacterium]